MFCSAASGIDILTVYALCARFPFSFYDEGSRCAYVGRQPPSKTRTEKARKSTEEVRDYRGMWRKGGEMTRIARVPKFRTLFLRCDQLAIIGSSFGTDRDEASLVLSSSSLTSKLPQTTLEKPYPSMSIFEMPEVMQALPFS